MYVNLDFYVVSHTWRIKTLFFLQKINTSIEYVRLSIEPFVLSVTDFRILSRVSVLCRPTWQKRMKDVLNIGAANNSTIFLRKQPQYQKGHELCDRHGHGVLLVKLKGFIPSPERVTDSLVDCRLFLSNDTACQCRFLQRDATCENT